MYAKYQCQTWISLKTNTSKISAIGRMIRELSYLVSLICNLVAATDPDTTAIIRYQNGHVLPQNGVTFLREVDGGKYVFRQHFNL